MKNIDDDFPVPIELQGEDVYNMLLLFDNEEEVIEFVINIYNLDKSKVTEELYEQELMRKEFGKENYLRSATVKGKDTIISELMSGEYILWIAY